ncbi:MAG: IS66 family insertion sequence element accessory protein TnpB [Atopobiaceae bacterium]|nr:IS66 family insertion sequence element accessory protein TnpB [Atopobiaceae bacterium]
MVQVRPQDMRADIQRRATVVEAELGSSPADGTLWCFVSRDRRKAKMLRYDSG